MAAGDNAESKRGYGEKEMEKEESVNARTVDCLRGRLLAERVASRNAKEEADVLGNKMMELKKLLEQEAKSRKRAEKRLKHLMKKLEYLNITYTSAESSGSEQSCLVDKSEVSSYSSLTSLSTTREISYDHQIKVMNANLKPNHSSRSSSNEVSSCCSMESEIARENEGPKPPSIISEKLEQNIADEGSSSFDTNSDKSTQMGSYQSCCKDFSKMDEHSESAKSLREDGINQEEEEEDGGVNSMALVPVEVQQQQQELDRIDPQIIDNTVKEVLDALKYAKEQLQSSMKRQRRNRNLIKVG